MEKDQNYDLFKSSPVPRKHFRPNSLHFSHFLATKSETPTPLFLFNTFFSSPLPPCRLQNESEFGERGGSRKGRGVVEKSCSP